MKFDDLFCDAFGKILADFRTNEDRLQAMVGLMQENFLAWLEFAKLLRGFGPMFNRTETTLSHGNAPKLTVAVAVAVTL